MTRFMGTGFVQGVLIALTAYSVTAVFAFLLVYAPFAGAGRLTESLIYAVLVLLPYAALIVACRAAVGRASRLVVAVASLVCGLIGGYVYWFSFGPNDGEYVFAYYIVPALQLPFVVTAWLAVLWGRYRKGCRHAA
jgi:hypothetical protein